MSTDFSKSSASTFFDGLSLKLAEDLVGIEQCKPVTLIGGFPRIMEKINETWPGRSTVEYIESLIISDRVDRGGFPPRVLSELCFLKELQTFLYPFAFEMNRSVEDLIHAPFQIRSIKALVDLHGPKSVVSLVDSLASKPREVDSGPSATGWGEIDNDAKLTEKLQEQRRPPIRLGELLVQHELVAPQERDSALALQQDLLAASPGRRREPLGKLLVQAGVIASIDLRKALVLQSQGLLVNLDMLSMSHSALALVSHSVAQDLGAVVLQIHGGILAVALENPLAYRGQRAVDALKKITGLAVRPAWASMAAIERKLQNYRPGPARKDF